MKKVKIYADGSCYQMAASSGKGGYGTILIFEENMIELSGAVPETTNNRMELTGIIAGMEYLTEPHEVEIYSDSAYVVECFLKGWFEKWFENGWKNSNGKLVKNKDLWLRLMKSMGGHKVKFIKVKGHADDYYNNRCDLIAKKASEAG